MVHEQVHIEQQRRQNDGEMGWWRKWLEDPEFRLSQELEAYQEQYQFFVKTESNREKVNQALWSIAGMLSSKIYGSVISHSEAVLAIKKK